MFPRYVGSFSGTLDSAWPEKAGTMLFLPIAPSFALVSIQHRKEQPVVKKRRGKDVTNKHNSRGEGAWRCGQPHLPFPFTAFRIIDAVHCAAFLIRSRSHPFLPPANIVTAPSRKRHASRYHMWLPGYFPCQTYSSKQYVCFPKGCFHPLRRSLRNKPQRKTFKTLKTPKYNARTLLFPALFHSIPCVFL